ncbi:MAG: TlpA disulfide reductase family protein [Phycisphaerales bacterium]|nr:TlpA disulfide reductase family protein [Phycisphaerales bacterium]
MNIKFLLLPFTVLLTVFTSCTNSKHKFVISVEMANMPEQKVLLEEMGINETKILDSIRTDSKGHFELSSSGNNESSLYRLHFSDNKFIILSLSGESVRIISDWNNLEAYTVKGSPASESLRNFFADVRKYINDIQTLTIVMDSMRIRGNDSMIELANKDMSDLNLQLTQYIEHYADTSKYLPNALFAVQILNPTVEKPFLDAFSTTIPSRFPKAQLGKDWLEHYKKGTAPTEDNKNSLEGDIAPEISLSTPEGATVKLSSFKGKYVLVDFWASWCTPCRKENPNVVAAYRMFKDKNFTILGVSLDNNKSKWQAAIAQDHLDWTHISDLKGWESIAARDYNISSIPANFLVDPNGKVIAYDLRGPDLENKLQEVLR